MDDPSEYEIRSLQHDLEQRRRLRPGPRRMGDVVSRLMSRRGYAQTQTSRQCLEAWRQAVGGTLARQSHPGNVRRGVLQVVVSNSTILQELTFQKKRLLQELARRVPDQRIQDLRFRVGAVPRN